MSDERDTEIQDPAERGRSGRPAPVLGRRIALLTAGTLLVATVGGAAWAATDSPGTPDSGSSESSEAAPPTDPDHGGPALRKEMLEKIAPDGFAFGHHGPGFGFGLGFALHGEAVVPKGDDGYQTIAMQNGKVTEVSSSEITVKSDDGYSRTYKVNADTLVNAARDGIDTVKKDHSVSVMATVSGDTATAVRITDMSVLRSFAERWPPGMKPRPLPDPDRDPGSSPSSSPRSS
jgi:hypothetical protein